MTKLCPIIKTVTCGPACAWFCEDVDACSIWKIAEGLVTLTAMVENIIEKDIHTREDIQESQAIDDEEEQGKT